MKRILSLVLINLIILSLFFFLHFINFPVKSEIKVYEDEVYFNGTSAYNYAYYLSKNFPKRVVGTQEEYEAFVWIKNNLEEMGYEVKTENFTVNIEYKRIGWNIYAFKKGSINETIAILGNYDMVPMSIEAASDTAGHVGVLLELARELINYNSKRNILFAFVSSEEWGMQGAKTFAKSFKTKVKVVIVAEDLTVGKITSLALESMGQFKGYSPLWLRKICKDVGDFMKIKVEDPVGIWEYIYRAVDISFTDQGPIIAEGISSIEISTRGDKPELAREVYHTEKDVMENMEIESFQIYGAFLKRLIISLDKAERIPDYEPDYLMVNEERYINSLLTWIIPSLLLLIVLSHLIYIREKSIRFLRSFLGVIIYFLSLLPSLLIVTFSVQLNFVVTYDTYPPPPKHPYLYSPNYLLLFLFFFLPALIIFFINKKIEKGNGFILALLLATIASLFFNRFGTVILLSQAIIFWPWIPYVKKRLIRLVLLLLGLTFFLILITFFSILIFTGPFIIWYLILGMAYGQFSLIGNIIAFFVGAIFIYLLIHFIIKK